MDNKAAVMTDIQTIEIREIEMPVPGEDDILVKAEYVGVCGSDVHYFESGHIGTRYVKPPFILGHECAGIVQEVGKNVKNFKIGDKVALEPGIPCGRCEFCKSGRYNICRDIHFLSVPPIDGLLKKYTVHPAHMAYKLPEGISTLEGALIEPLVVGIHATELGNAGICKSAAIFGSGCIGLSTLLACKLMGVSKTIISDLYDNRLDKALELGANLTVNASREDTVKKILEYTDGKGVDIVFETAGSKVTAYQTSFVVGNGGTIVLVGNVVGDITFNFRNMTLMEASLKTVWRYCNDFPKAIDAISGGKTDVGKIATDIYDFDDSQQAFNKAMNDKQNVIKAVIRM